MLHTSFLGLFFLKTKNFCWVHSRSRQMMGLVNLYKLFIGKSMDDGFERRKDWLNQ